MNKIKDKLEKVENEILEIEADQHPDFYKDSKEARTRMVELLQKLDELKVAVEQHSN